MPSDSPTPQPSDLTIKCPECGSAVPLTQAMAAPLLQAAKDEYQRKLAAKDDEIAKREQELQAEQAKLDEQRKSIDEQVSARVKEREGAIAKAREDLDKAKQSMQDEIDARVQSQRERLKEEAERKARDAASLDLKEQKELIEQLQASLKQRDERLDEARKEKTEFLRMKAELEDKEKEIELTIQQRVAESREEAESKALQRFEEANKLKNAEKDKQLADATERIKELQRKLEQGSQQIQGEVAEMDLEDVLKRAFPFDQFDPVPTGIRGADVLQRVRNEAGQPCGVILWESKHTKNWSDQWLPKLREDGRTAKADLLGLVSTILPKDVANLALKDGVWVCDRACVLGLATALRAGLLELGKAKAALDGQQGKMERVYHYLTGPQFSQRIEAIVESFATMQDDLAKEKRAIQNQWAKREKQLERAITSAVGMHGDLQGIVGGGLPELPGANVALFGEGASDLERSDA